MTTALRRSPGKLSRIALCLALVGLVAVAAAPAQNTGHAKLSLTAKGNDCKGCHGASNPLPKDHPSIAGKTLPDCAACHAPGSGRELTGRMPLFHAHLLDGLTCSPAIPIRKSRN